MLLLKQFLLTVSVASVWVPALQAATLADCAGIVDNTARLACFDGLTASVPAPKAGDELVDESVTAEITPQAGSDTEGVEGEPELLVAQRLKLEEESANNPWVITPHYRNYLLPVTYNHNVNVDPLAQLGSPVAIDDVEAKFQISLLQYYWRSS